MRRPLLFIFTFIVLGCSLISTPMPTATSVAPTVTHTITPTLEPFEEYTIEHLRGRTYGGGKIEVLTKLLETDQYTSYSIRYPSDGLTIYGFVNVPRGEGPFPVIVSVHAYAPYGAYDVFLPYNDFAGYFAENGFIVLHPGLRNHPPSDSGDNLARVGMSVDVLNLIALAKEAQWSAELSQAQTDHLGLWGMSLGGEIALRVLTVSRDIRATVLYSSLTGDIERNSKQLYSELLDEQFQRDLQIPTEMFPRISPIHEYDTIESAIQLHHGTEDTTVPLTWANETCDLLAAAGVSIECVYYEAGHVFNRSNYEAMLPTALKFYQMHLLP